MSKSGDWYTALKERDPVAHRTLMDKKYASRVGQLNSDPVKFTRMKYTKQRNGAKDRKLEWNLTAEQVHDLIMKNNCCEISGRELVLEVNHIDGASIDRIDNSRGYFIDNVQVTSQIINKARGTMTVDEFIEMCCQVANFHNK
jgi:hypothetical protein